VGRDQGGAGDGQRHGIQNIGPTLTLLVSSVNKYIRIILASPLHNDFDGYFT